MAAKVERWLNIALAEADDLQRRCGSERLHLEVEIESEPLEPQFSSHVQSMIQMEEKLGMSGKTEQRRELSEKIERKMREEAMAALQYIIELHEKKRRVLFSRQGSDRKKLELHLYQQLEELQREVTMKATTPKSRLAEASPSSTTVSSENDDDSTAALEAAARSEPVPSSRGTPDGWAAREEEYMRACRQNWLNGEHYNFEVAFQHQIDRLDVEWGEFCDQLFEEYAVNRARLQSVPVAHVKAELQNELGHEGALPDKKESGHPVRSWLSKEKQETLVHTAPVLSPVLVSGGGGGGSGSWREGRRTSRSQRVPKREMMARVQPRDTSGRPVVQGLRVSIINMHSQFLSRRRQAMAQWDMAKRWVIRQKMRMQLQADAQDTELTAISDFELREKEALQALRARVSTRAKDVMSQANLMTPAGKSVHGRSPASAIPSPPLLMSGSAPKASFLKAQRSPSISTPERRSSRLEPLSHSPGAKLEDEQPSLSPKQLTTFTDSTGQDSSSPLSDRASPTSQRKSRRGGPNLRAVEAAASNALRLSP